ncbi:MAG TPA: DUF1269 domain-containing protein [Phycisphaerae bacterium]|nr:DUF1269 domain-containing protein [Phycisphaerae bacterium]
MPHQVHLWAVGYDDVGRAEQVREEITRLCGPERYLILLDVAVVVRRYDGSFLLDGAPLSMVGRKTGRGMSRFLACVALSASATAAAALETPLDCGCGCNPGDVGIDDEFIQDVSAIMRPGTSTIFLLDDVGNMGAILHRIWGLGGTVLRTNVHTEPVRLMQSAQSAW